MSRLIKAVPVFLLFALALPAPVQAQAVNLLVQMMGTPVRKTTLTSTGTSASITITAGVPLLVICDAKTHVGRQSTCTATITDSNYCPVQATDERVYIIPNGTTLSAISSSGTANCSVFEMR